MQWCRLILVISQLKVSMWNSYSALETKLSSKEAIFCLLGKILEGYIYRLALYFDAPPSLFKMNTEYFRRPTSSSRGFFFHCLHKWVINFFTCDKVKHRHLLLLLTWYIHAYMYVCIYQSFSCVLY